LLGARQLEGDGHPGHGVDVRAALLAGEDGAIQLAANGGVMGHQHRAARAVHRLVGGEADDVGMADRAGHDPGGGQAGDVGNIRQQVGADGIGDLAEASVIGHIGIAGEAADDQPGAVLFRQLLDRVVVKKLGLGIDAIADDIIVDAAAVGGAAMRQVPTVEQIHAHHRLAGLDEGRVDGVVGRRAGERLDVDPQLFRRDGGRGE